jgi:PET assembly of cytochrome c oxidase, mitochondrial
VFFVFLNNNNYLSYSTAKVFPFVTPIVFDSVGPSFFLVCLHIKLTPKFVTPGSDFFDCIPSTISSYLHSTIACQNDRFQMNTRTKPNRGPAIVLGITSLATIGAIIYSHYSQIRDKQVMREGIQRDKERLRMKRKLKQESEM